MFKKSFIIVLCFYLAVGVTACSRRGEQPAPHIPSVSAEDYKIITFPANTDELTEFSAHIYETEPFDLSLALPDGWSLERCPLAGGYDFITVFSKLNFFNEKKECVGVVGYNIYELYEGAEDDPRAIYNQIALGNNYQFDVRNSYSVVNETDSGTTAVVDVYYAAVINDGVEKINKGIVAYNKDFLVYIAAEFDADKITDEQILNIAKSIQFARNEYHGLTKEEYEDLQAQKAKYEAMTDEQKQIARESGTVGCKKFIHLWWEESIDMNFIDYVGSEAFNKWINEHKDSGDCLDIYSFADEFGLDLNTLKTIITENHLEEFYPLDRLETRYTACQRKSITPQDFVQELSDSVTFDSQAGNINFTIPNEIPDNYTIYLHVSGRSKMGDGSMSFHAFEEESENNSWKLGETYNYKIGKDALLEGIVDVGLIQNDNKKLQYNQLVTIDENGTILFE